MNYLEMIPLLTHTAQTVGFRVHGVSLNLHGDYTPLMDYMMALLPGMVGDPSSEPDLEVYAHWVEGPCDEDASLFPPSPGLSGMGKRMQMGPDELVWLDTHRDKDMQLRFRRQNSKFIFDVAYCHQPSAGKLKKYPNFQQKKFFDLARYLVHFPMAWHLERTRGWALLHAAAVAHGDQAILIAGPGGAGKTTTSMALIARTGMALLTENMLFTDGRSIFPVLEPIRLTGDSLSLLRQSLAGLEPMEMPGGLKDKTMFWLPQERRLDPAQAIALFLPQFAPRSFVEAIQPAVAGEQIGAANRLTLELNNYYWYTAALDLLWPAPGNAQRQLQTIQTLTTNTPCYSLGINKATGVEPVVDQILASLPAHVGL